MHLRPQRQLHIAAFADNSTSLGYLKSLLTALDVRLVTAETFAKTPALSDTLIDIHVISFDVATSGGLASICALRQLSQLPIFLLYATFTPSRMLLACEFGANGHAVMQVAPADLDLGLQAVARGGFFLCPTIWTELGTSYFGQVNTLTAREAQIVALAAAGETNRAIAEGLSISEKLVEHHLRQLYGKTQVSNRTELAVWWSRTLIQMAEE